jgi:hypothetical protein
MLLANENEAVLVALARLRQSGDWEVLESWLKASREHCVKQSLNADEAKSRQSQGGFALLDEFLQLTQKAHELSRR